MLSVRVRPGAHAIGGVIAEALAGSATVAFVEIQRGMAGAIPYAAVGTGPPVIVLCGLWPTVGVLHDRLVRGAVAPLREATGRRLVVINRRRNMPSGFTMQQLAAEYAEAIRLEFGAPIDVFGMSTGGSIAQQLAADHPDVVRRLVLMSTAWRLEGMAKSSQVELAAHLRAGRRRSAAALLGDDAAPRGLRRLTRGLFWAAAQSIFGDDQEAADLATTLEAEDEFDLSSCPPIQAPTLIVGGGRDRYYTRRQFEETAALIPQSRMHVESLLGHVAVGSSPRVRHTIASFLAAPAREELTK